MDLNKLSKGFDGENSTLVFDSATDEKAAAKKFLTLRRKISDSLRLPSNSEVRSGSVRSNIRSILSELNLSDAEMTYVEDSFLVITKAYESRVNKVADSHSSLKVKYEALNAKCEETKKIVDSMTKEMESYKKLGSVESIKKKISDADVVIQSKEEADAELQSAKDELEKTKEDLRLKEEELKAREEKEKSEVHEVKDAYDPELLQKFAKCFEDWIQSGSVVLAEKLKQYAQAIDDKDLVILVDRATSYNLDQESYEELSANLKAELAANDIKIPSLALIADSAEMDTLKEKGKTIELCLGENLGAALKNYVEEPNDETCVKLQQYYDQVPDGDAKNAIGEVMINPANPQSLKEALKILKGAIKGDKPLELSLNPEWKRNHVATSLEEVGDVYEEPLSKVKFLAVSDSVSRYKRAKRFAVKDCDTCVSAPVERFPVIGDVVPVSGDDVISDFVSVTVDGVACLYSAKDADCAVAIANLQALRNDPTAFFTSLSENFIPLESIVNAAKEIGDLDIVTDSALYRRKISDKFWVTDSLSIDDMKGQLVKLISLFNERVPDSYFGKGSKRRVVVSDSALSESIVKDFTSILTKEVKLKEINGYNVAFCSGE
jgi:hypothetical protein